MATGVPVTEHTNQPITCVPLQRLQVTTELIRAFYWLLPIAINYLLLTSSTKLKKSAAFDLTYNPLEDELRTAHISPYLAVFLQRLARESLSVLRWVYRKTVESEGCNNIIFILLSREIKPARISQWFLICHKPLAYPSHFFLISQKMITGRII